jgi:hypothetical protein
MSIPQTTPKATSSGRFVTDDHEAYTGQPGQGFVPFGTRTWAILRTRFPAQFVHFPR